MSAVAVNDHRCKYAILAIPWHGVWWADVHFDESIDEFVAGAHATLRVNSSLYQATVFRGSNYHGSYRARLVGGAGGWGKQLPVAGYSHSSGVKLSLVLKDITALNGETVSLGKDVNLGSFYVRAAGPASDALRGCDWYIDEDGITQIRQRSSGVVASDFTFIGGKYADGRLTVATDSPEDWLPGKKFSNLWVNERTISSIIHTFDAKKVRTEVWFK
jgi:hypothetical protein